MSDQNPSGRKERPLPAAWTDNPYQAPTAHVEDTRSAGDGTLLDEADHVGTGRGIAWWSEGWSLFREATGLWIGIGVVLIIINVVLGMIPLVGQIATYLLIPVFGGGLMLGCYALDNGEGLSFGHLFAGFQNNFGQLALVGLLYMLGFVAIGIIIFAISGAGVAMAMFKGGHGGGIALSTIMGGVLLGVALGIPLAMAMWFAPALVALHDVPAARAMKLSFQGCWRNMMPFLIYGIVFIVLAVIATIPVGLGWLVLVPTMVCSTYVSYKEIFTAGGQ